jgi:hypothetical protein
MAKQFLPASLIILFMITGCQSNPHYVENVPPPGFSGPSVATNSGPGPASPPATATPPKNRTARADGSVPRAWTPSVAARHWKWIVIHHSATPSGSAKSFDRMHKEKGWDELGYHFVIGNGTDTGNGQIEVGARWSKQKWGAHAKTPDNQFNDYGIGICLVGNFDIERPTPQQLRSLAKLVAYLEKTYRIPASRVVGHSDTKPTDCPGRNLNVATVRRMAAQMLADTGEMPDEIRTASSVELADPDAGEQNPH